MTQYKYVVQFRHADGTWHSVTDRGNLALRYDTQEEAEERAVEYRALSNDEFRVQKSRVHSKS